MIYSALGIVDRQTTTTTSNTGAQQFAEAMNNASTSANGSPQGAQNGTVPAPKITGEQWFDFGLGLTLFGAGFAETMYGGASALRAPAELESSSDLGGGAKAADGVKGLLAGGVSGPYLMWQGLVLMTPVNNAISQWYEKYAPNMPENPGA